ncbi:MULTISPECIES: hypothetical protein [unclassified Streptomyces]|nr:hypothetical protein [Streptomyces sp. CB01883]
MTASQLFGLTVEDWAQMLGAAERGEGPEVDWPPPPSTTNAKATYA